MILSSRLASEALCRPPPAVATCAQAGDCAVVDVPVLPKTLALVGLMGAGKSAIGRRLAARFNVAFIDADQVIEEAAGCSIPEIFDRWGESFFRDRERQVIARLLRDPAHVMATGGGAFMADETRALILDQCLSLWLRADLDLLVSRTARRNNRPLLAKGKPRDILKQLMDERYPMYERADIVVGSRDVPPDETADMAVAAIRRFLEERV